jgi:arginine deiminase
MRTHATDQATTDARPSAAYGVHSEVGRLHKVLVCSPGLAHRRLTPTNSDDLLFDDVMWVENAQRDHQDFVNKLRNRGVDVVELHELLAQTVAIREAKAWLLDRKIVPNEVGLGLVDGTRAFLESLEPPGSPSTSSAASPRPTCPTTSGRATWPSPASPRARAST